MRASTLVSLFSLGVFAALPTLGLFVTGCAVASDGEDVESQEGAQVAASAAEVDVVMTAEVTGSYDTATAYPVPDVNGDGREDRYRVPVYRLYIEGRGQRREWTALRFMPYWNPGGRVRDYSTQGWANAGLTNIPRRLFQGYKPEYEIHNTESRFNGALVVQNTFYIHAGPETLQDPDWGSAGCVEIIGDFEKFKADIVELGGLPTSSIDAGLARLVRERRLFVTYQPATRPDLRSALVGQGEPVEDEDE